MTKKWIVLALASMCMGLVSCGSREETSSNTGNASNNGSATSSTTSGNVGGSSTSSGNTTESTPDETNPTAWSESDLKDMSKYLNGYTCLPFPEGFTNAYVNASGTDEDGECFIAYDGECGDLSESYGKQLTAASFVFDSKETDEDGDVYYYTYAIEDSNDLINVQFDYYRDAFEIFAWYEVGAPTYETFPYEAIAAFFKLEKVDESALPSFPLLSGQKYDGYASGETYFLVGGNYDTSIEEATYVANYETALTNAGYTVDSENGTAINEAKLLKVEYMASEGYFFIQISKYVPVIPGANNVEFSPSDFPAKYGAAEITKNNVLFRLDSIMFTNGYIQFRKAGDKGSGYLYNVDSLGTLTSITVTEKDVSKHDYYGVLSCYVSSSVISDTNPGTAVTPTYTDGVYTYPIPAGNSFFQL
ncbi:MAG: hypothetical protein SOV72_05130, partial [Candidatus Enteromonas sp.]|nr:hypothetical protein [Candidatus Enteromonas sp.]